ncbi:hypothetical protein [Rubellimicrobium arenae]|uniref:hypothetical protein n=1 Tax=Rubellimicrobium arenae TaxID=2817372 RepID=UPI001B317215|nr:hypothetical protein [Rubellimicrobium arenae]
MRILSALLAMLPAVAMAEPFAPPVPQAQTSEAEFWYAVASVAMLLTLLAVQRLVARR